jgi:GTP-sensing pleiotropic transcriptional regulator CodY
MSSAPPTNTLFLFQLQSADSAGDTDPALLAEPTKPPPETDLSHPEKLAIVLPSAPTYHQTSSLLLALRDAPFPEESVSAEIANALPQVVELQLQLAEKEERVRALAARSLAVLTGWYGMVEGVNRCVAEWDDRLRDAETVVVRRERAVRDAEEY